MKILKSIAVAFSLYSRIPMPRFNWGTEDMKFHLVFFPWIGAVIGALEYGWLLLCDKFNIEHIVFTIIALVIPLIVTGGFHLDGFMDTSDALSSWQDKERRLEILKDSHVGAFAIIKLVILGGIGFAAVHSMNRAGFIAWIFIFFISRAISGICVVKYKKAKNDGLLNTEAKTAGGTTVMILLAIQFVVVSSLATFMFQWYFTAVLLGLFVALVYYLYTAYSKFGGITGDLAGWFVCNAEVLAAVAVAIGGIYGSCNWR